MATYTITATCNGETATATVTVPAPPMTVTADISDLLADITVQDIPREDLRVTVDWGDGSATETLPNVGSTATGGHTYANDSGNPYTITVTGNTTGAVATTTATVVEPAPTKLATPTGLASSAITQTGFKVDWTAVPNASSYTATASPTGPTASISGTTATFTGGTAGTKYTVSVVAVGDGTTYSDSDAATLDVTTTALSSPTVAIDASQDPDITANVTTIDGSDTTISIDWGDGTSPDTGIAVTSNAASKDHTYADNGTYTVTATGDVSTKAGTGSAAVAAALAIVGTVTTDPEASVTVTGLDATDTTATIDWGDGNSDTAQAVTDNGLTKTHTYTANGTYNPTVTGDTTSDTATSGDVVIAAAS